MAAEQITLIRAGMDSSDYEAGARRIEAANTGIANSTRQLENGGERTQRTVTMTVSQYEKLRQTLDKTVKATADYAVAEAKINAAHVAGHSSLIAKNREIDQARAKYLGLVPAANAAAGAIKLTANESLNLGYQLQDFAVQIGSGQGIFRPLLQQAPQAIGAVGGVSNAMALLRQNAGALLTGAGIAGVAAGLFLVGAAAERNQRSINGLATGLQRTRSDFTGAANEINTAARRLAETTTLGTQEARDALGTLANVPGFRATQENLIETGRVAQNLGAIFKEDVGEGAKRLAEAFRDPAAAAKRYAEGGAEGIRGFGAEFVRTVELMQAGGNRAGAAALVFGRIADASKNAAERGTALQQALRGLNQELARVGNDGSNSSRSFGEAMTAALAGIVSGATAALGALSRLRSMTISMPGSIREGRLVTNGWVDRQAASQAADRAATPAPAPGEVGSRYTGGNQDFAAALAQRESGGNAGIRNPGSGATGLYQFTPQRMADMGMYAPSEQDRDGRRWTGAFNGQFLIPGHEGVNTLQDFQASPAAQNAAFAEHIRRIDAAIDRLGTAGNSGTIAGVPVNRDGLRAVAHLGGETGMRRFVESGGAINPNDRATGGNASLRDYYVGFSRGGATPASANAPPAGSASSPIDPAEAGRIDAANRLRQAQERDSLRAQREALNEEIRTHERDRDAAPEGSTDRTDLTAGIQARQAQLERLIPAEQALNDATARQNRIAAEADPAQRAVAEAMERVNEAARQRGAGQNDPDVVTERANAGRLALEGMTQAYAQQGQQLERTIAGENRVAAAWAQGATAAAYAANAERALNEVRASGIVGDDARAAAAARLTEQYNRQTRTAAETAVAQRSRDSDQTLETIALQRRLVGTDASTAAQEMAGLKAAQDASRIAGITPGDTSRMVGSAREIAAANQALNEYQQSWKTVESAAGSAIDKMGEGLLKFAEGGKDAFKSLRTTAASTLQEIAKEILKMGVLNPIKNAMFGGSQPTFGALSGGGGGGGGGLGGLLAGLFSGGGGAAAEAGSAAVADSFASSAVYAFHSGGIAGDATGLMRDVPNAIFREAPRYHTGGMAGGAPGLMPDEIPAVLRRRELVMTEQQQAATRRAISRPGGTVNVTMPIYAASVDSFRASSGQAKAAMAKTLRSAARSM